MAGPAPGTRGEARNDLRFRVLELRRDRNGSEVEQRSVSLQAPQVGDCAPSGDPVDLSVQLETVTEGVRVTGTVTFDWVGPCRRCLETARGAATSDFEELFVDDPGSWVATEDSAVEDVHPIEGGWIDLGEVVRDTVLLGLPLAPVCRPDCGGPDPAAFPVGTASDTSTAGEASSRSEDAPAGSGEEEPPMDPRWAKLSEFRFDSEDDGDDGVTSTANSH